MVITLLAINLAIFNGCGHKDDNSDYVPIIDTEEIEGNGDTNYQDNDWQPEPEITGDDSLHEDDSESFDGENNEEQDENRVLTAWNRWVMDDDKTACKSVNFSPALVDITKTGDAVTEITTKDIEGNTIHMKCEGVRISDDGMYFILEKSAKMYLTDELCGIKYMDMECEEDYNSWFQFDMMFSLTEKSGVKSDKELIVGQEADFVLESSIEASFRVLPNYARISVSADSIAKVKNFTVYYTGERTGVRDFYLNPEFYPYFVLGEKYNAKYEQFNPDEDIWYFYVNAKIDSPYIEDYEIGDDIYAIPNITPGNLHRADGSIKSKTDYIEEGDYLDFTYEGKTFLLDTVVAPLSKANNYHETMNYATMEATGDLRVCVLPVLFADQEWTEADEAELKAALGRVVEADGTVREYAPFSGEESLSSYFDKASYGQFHIDSFIAKPYEFKKDYGEDYTFDIYRDAVFSDYKLMYIADWLNEQYEDLSAFDKDGNGLFDALYIVNPGDMKGYNSYKSISFAGAHEYREYEGMQLVRYNGSLGVNYVIYCPLGFLHDGNIRGVDDYDTGTFIHEFSHAIGVQDYYDTNYKGISALGGFDMQDDNNGDWNAYSKYAAGWVKPVIVLPSQIEEKGSVEITIDAYATSGDCIIIPTKQSENSGMAEMPFSEYILIDLFTDEGLYEKDAAKYGLKNTSGVRMYHVDARYIERKGIYLGEPYTFSESHYNNSYNKNNKYLITLIQAGGNAKLINTNNKDMTIKKDDLFVAGSSFSVNRYKDYFSDNKMNDGSTFPYSVFVESIENDKAVIQISK